MQLLDIRALKISVYHPQIDGLVERFNGTFKAILRKFVNDDPWNWDKPLPALLFAVWEVPEASTGFSPFKFLCKRQPRGILDLLWETWEEQESHATGRSLYLATSETPLEAQWVFSAEFTSGTANSGAPV